MSQAILRIYQQQTLLIKSRSNMDRPSVWNAGKIVADSSTDKVLRFLTDNSGRSFTRSEIVEKTDLSSKLVGWALHYLKINSYIESFNFGGMRSPLYLRYRVKK